MSNEIHKEMTVYDLANLMMKGFEGVEQKRAEMEERLTDKIEAIHTNAHHRMDRFEDKIHTLV